MSKSNVPLRRGIREDPRALVMYIDMNSFFASCEQQDHQIWRNKPIGVCTHDSPYACVIAPSVEAKRFGIKTGMRLQECRQLCPAIIPVAARPWRYRRIHLDLMQLFFKYCEDVTPKSIDEAVLNLTDYRLIYPDAAALARKIKEDIHQAYDYLTCSIGIAPNVFLAKLGTELQKPDGLIEIRRDNIDEYLSRLQLTDLPGIGRKYAKRLELSGIRTPLHMRYTSPALLRKVFGGIEGDYWHYRLHFKEIDLYQNPPRSMSAMRTVSPAQRTAPQSLDHLLTALCCRLEQRLVKQNLFCGEAAFFIRYTDRTHWETSVRFTQPRQDAIEIRNALLERIREFEKAQRIKNLIDHRTLSMGLSVHHFIPEKNMSYTLFENTWKADRLRKTIYAIRDLYGSKTVGKASELMARGAMQDAIGFGSVKDMQKNPYLLEPGAEEL